MDGSTSKNLWIVRTFQRLFSGICAQSRDFWVSIRLGKPPWVIHAKNLWNLHKFQRRFLDVDPPKGSPLAHSWQKSLDFAQIPETLLWNLHTILRFLDVDPSKGSPLDHPCRSGVCAQPRGFWHGLALPASPMVGYPARIFSANPIRHRFWCINLKFPC